MSQPLVSVCVPTYNHVDFIGGALSSALEQDFDSLEVVVADDGSTDGTYDVVRDYEEKYPGRLVVLPSQPNRGLAGLVTNYNRALRACRGRYVAFLEGDDLYLPGKITRQVEWMEADPRRALCGHDVEAFDSHSGQRLYLWSDHFRLRSGKGARNVVRGNVPFCTVSVMIRASTVPPGGFDERLRAVLDWKFWIDCLASGGRFGYVEGVHARYRRHSGNLTARFQEIRQDDQFVTLGLVESRYPHLFGSCRHARAALCYSMGIAALRSNDRRRARLCFANAVRAGSTPGWKAAVRWCLSFSERSRPGTPES